MSGLSACENIRTRLIPLALLLATTMLLATALAALCPVQAYAVSGEVYAGTLVRCYKHPVTGVIEDSGGQSAYATGQGMVEGCLSTKAQLEVTDDGQCFLTIRLGLIDYTKNRSFKVQQWGAKGWSKTKFAVSKKGKDKNGTTHDYCIKVPSQKCIVRMTMFVTPMGRNVVCYMYPKNLRAGHEKGMVAKIVTSVSRGTTADALEGANDNGSSGDSGGSGSTAKMLGGAGSSGSSDGGGGNAGNAAGTGDTASGSDGSEAGASEAASTAESADPQTGATGGASGLALSTDDGQGSSAQSGDAQAGAQSGGISPAVLFAVVAGAIVVGGGILFAIVLVVVWYIRTRKNGWRTDDPDDYAKAYAESLTRDTPVAPASAGAGDATRKIR